MALATATFFIGYGAILHRRTVLNLICFWLKKMQTKSDTKLGRLIPKPLNSGAQWLPVPVASNVGYELRCFCACAEDLCRENPETSGSEKQRAICYFLSRSSGGVVAYIINNFEFEQFRRHRCLLLSTVAYAARLDVMLTSGFSSSPQLDLHSLIPQLEFH
jgi:hypothetical protein